MTRVICFVLRGLLRLILFVPFFVLRALWRSVCFAWGEAGDRAEEVDLWVTAPNVHVPRRRRPWWAL